MTPRGLRHLRLRRLVLASLCATAGASVLSVSAFAYMTAPATGTSEAQAEVLGAPGDLAAPTTTSSSVALSWAAPANLPAGSGYLVFRSTSPFGAAKLPASSALASGGCASTTTSTSSSTGCTDTGVSAATTYYYEVEAAYGTTWVSLPSSTVEVTTSAATQATPTLDFVQWPAAGTVDQALTANGIEVAVTGGSNPTGTITFSVFGPQASPPTACSAGAAAWSGDTAAVEGTGDYHPAAGFTPGAAGVYWWYASYGGGNDNEPAATVCDTSNMPHTVVADPAATATKITMTDPTTLTYGSENETAVTGTVTGHTDDGHPAGKVTVDATGSPLTNCTTLSLVAASSTDASSFTCTLGSSQLQAGHYSLTASYAPGVPSSSDSYVTYEASQSSTVGLSVVAAGASTATTLDPAPVLYGSENSSPVTGVVTGQSGDGHPEGKVTVDATGSPLTGCTTLGLTAAGPTDAASFTCALGTTEVKAGSYSLTAKYTPAPSSSTDDDISYQASSTKAASTLAVGKAATTTTLQSNDASPKSGALVTFSVTVSSDAGTPTGDVTFYATPKAGTQAAIAGCTSVPLVAGKAACATSALTSKSSPYSISASFLGSSTFASSPSGSLTETISSTAVTKTRTTVAASATTIATGSLITFTATVARTGTGSGTPSGTVSFYVTPKGGTKTLIAGCTAVLLASGKGACETSAFVTAGTYSVVALYNGSTTFATSTSSGVTVTVKKGTVTKVASSANPSAVGATVTFTATVTGATGTAIPSSGSVTFKTGTKALSCASGSSAYSAKTGRATCLVKYTAASTGHSITATFTTSTATYLGSTSAALVQVVEKS